MPARTSSSSPLSPQAIEKADRPLREALERSPHDATVRVVMTLGAPEEHRPPVPAATRGRSRRGAVAAAGPLDRRSLIDARKREMEAAFGALCRSLEGHGLKVAGGVVTRSLVAEGSVADVARCLDFPQVRRAVLDREWSRAPVQSRVRSGRGPGPSKPRPRAAAGKRPSRRPAGAAKR